MWLVGVPLIAYLLVLGYLYVFQRQLLYFPDRSRPQLGVIAQLGVREVWLTTVDGLALLSWYLPPREGRPVIVYFHGNGGNIGYHADRIEGGGALRGNPTDRRSDPGIAVHQRRRARPIPLPLYSRCPLDLGSLRFAVAHRRGKGAHSDSAWRA